jgi:Phasin protein
VSNRSPRGIAANGGQGPNTFLAPALGLGMWNPFWAAVLKGNARAQEGFGTIASEWQDFVGRRLSEDFALVQRLSHSCTPDQILNAYTDFWQKAAEDYGREVTTMTKLFAGVTSKMVVAAQSATDEASTRLFPSREAA